jgi:hypothetical protein
MSQSRLKSKELKVSALQKQLQHVNLNAAGIDVGSDRHLVAVPEGRDDVAVREFGAFTADLQALAKLVIKVRRDYRGHGINGRLLDPGVRTARRIGVRS